MHTLVTFQLKHHISAHLSYLCIYTSHAHISNSTAHLPFSTSFPPLLPIYIYSMGTSHEHNMECEKCDTKSTFHLIPLLQSTEKTTLWCWKPTRQLSLWGLAGGQRGSRLRLQTKMLVVLSLGLLLVIFCAHFEIHKIEFRIFVLFHMST